MNVATAFNPELFLNEFIEEREYTRPPLSLADLPLIQGIASRCLVKPLEVEFFHYEDDVPVFTASLMKDPRRGQAPWTFCPEGAGKGYSRQAVIAEAFGGDDPQATARVFFMALCDWHQIEPFRRLKILPTATQADQLLHAPRADSPLTV